MLIAIQNFGGLAPKIKDPALLPDNKAQTAKNCRFDRGGLLPIDNDLPIDTRSDENPVTSLFRYQDGNFFGWAKDVDAVTAPLASDAYKRVFFGEGGALRVTDKDIYKEGGVLYPMNSYVACPPIPSTAPSVEVEAIGISLTIVDSDCDEDDGTYDLVISGGSGSGAEGTYTVLDGVITSVDLTNTGAYTVAPSVATTTGYGLITAVLGDDPTLMETRGYVYTLVNDYGSEGPPSPVSSLVSVYDGAKVTVNGLLTSVDSEYNITKKRLYRINQGSSSAIYQFVVELDLDDASYEDEIEDSELGEEIPSAEWDAAPLGIKGIIPLPDGSLAGFVDNILCRSVPYYPHAWPVSYQRAVPKPIVSIGSFGTTVAVLTSGKPYLAVGNTPENVVMEEMDLGYACVSKRGTVQAGDMVVYPAPEGLVAIGPNIRDVVTSKIMTKDNWNNYNPASLSAYYWEDYYVGFYTKGGKKAGFIFNLVTKEFTELPFYATAGYREPGTGNLYLVT